MGACGWCAQLHLESILDAAGIYPTIRIFLYVSVRTLEAVWLLQYCDANRVGRGTFKPSPLGGGRCRDGPDGFGVVVICNDLY